ncbi:MAG: ribonuclease H family protein [Flavobacteriales bacterium]|nr:ribonuclease H family protein [Flavobacteriales bacterium]
MAGKKKFYVVWKGHRPGVYDSWNECQRQTAGYAGALFKSFSTRKEAEQALRDPASVKSKPSSKKSMYYVVWHGHKPGIYTSWEEASAQIRGADHPKYKSFGSKELAERAWKEGPEEFSGRSFKKTRDLTADEKLRIGTPNMLSISVDAACNARTGACEYRGVITDSGTQIFHQGPYEKGTNNIGEFLALVHALAYLHKSRSDMPIYSDSRIAMKWVAQKKANTSTANPKLQQLIKRAESWLKENTYSNPILKWETKAWGEIPADFGRK